MNIETNTKLRSIVSFKNIILLIFLLFPYYGFGSLESLGKLFNLDQFNLDQLTQTKTFSAQIDKEIEGLKKRRVDQIDLYNLRKPEIESLKSSIDSFKEKIKSPAELDDEFSGRYLMILNQSAQTLSEVHHVHQQIINIIDNNIKLLQEFKLDPEFKSRSLRLASKSIYSIEDLQKINDILLQYDNKIKNIDEKIKRVSSDIEQLRKNFNLAKQEYEEKKKEQKEFKADEEGADSKFTVGQKAQLLDEEEKLLRYKKDLAEFKLKELEQKRHLFDTELRTSKIQLEIIIDEYERVKNELCIDEKDLKKFEETLKNQIQELAKNQESATKKISALDLVKNAQMRRMTELKRKYKLSESNINNIKEWSLHPNQIEGWSYLISIGKLTNYLSYELNISKEEIVAQIDNEKSKVTDKEVDNLIVNTWYKLITGKLTNFAQEDLIAREIKNYEKLKADLKASISTTSDRQAEVVSALNSNNIIIENIKSRMNELKDQKDTVFKDHQTEYNKFTNELKEEGYDLEPKRNESITQLIELYNTINNVRKTSIKKIDIIIEELRTRAQGIGVAILWKGLRNFIPDINKFFLFLYQKDWKDVLKVNKQTYSNLVRYYKQYPSEFALILFNIAIIIFSFIFVKIYNRNFIKLFQLISPKYGIGYTISNFIIVTFEFVVNNLSWLFLWLLGFLSVRYKFIDSYASIVFYLFSIIFWLILAYKYIRFLAKQNTEKDYFLVSKEYQRRFLTVLSIDLYINIFIFFLREAFIISPFSKSDVPMTLQAIQFITLQIGLIFILSKEQILKLIPRTTSFWQWIYEQVENYYYLFLVCLIFIIVMSNPYLGYGPQFFYFISRFLLILLLIPVVSAVHNRIKRISTSIFFYSDNEGIKERFPHAKTVYGVFVILSFLFFIGLAAIIAANILGYNIGFQTIYNWLDKEIYHYTDLNTGKHVSVSILDFSYVGLWVLGGIIGSYIVNRFVLSRIFDLLLVNIGIQNAIISLVRYTIIIASFVIGLRSVGLGSVIIYILAILGGLGVAGKELITDLIGYFIILIQRPIKIGDFIKINDDVNGIVRHITLRSVILRRKNSVTIIVPNSQVMSKPVVNWNYSRTYFAFDDILLTVPYKEDAEIVKNLIFKVIDNNINILKNPVPIVWLYNFTDNGYQFLVRGYISFDRVLEQWQIASDIRLSIVKTLRENGIEIASPVRLLKFIDNNPEIIHDIK
ncbi:mechanosensitive ion channel domain-containing protein [Candidatus Babela massiliensis]|uniref:Mechanosensitive ion channel protein n=1 Tax=Candidatus Babela massiliensis TaxID=673862 RepID=V6DK51_9BACT|nr:mechanosensitive ion channel domain-containing protein [Candidatus Babela massiliensis]CDK30906.1 mechanosensitive ion channel protein [Candidatus Babela massiliensis]